MNLKFSVSMCVYGKDNPEHFKTAVDSILKQTLPPDEVVLVVDGPVPDTLDAIIRDYEANSAFKVIRLSQNVGHGNARRTGLENCLNEIVALMDADDISLSDRFEKQINVFNTDGSIDIVGGNITEFINDESKVVGKRIVPSDDKSIKEYIKRCPMNLVTVMFKKQSVNKVGGFIDWYCEEDYYLWLRMALVNMKFANVSDILVNVRVGKEMYQRRGGWKYYKSEVKFQKYMLKNKIIGFPTYFFNKAKRFIVQVLLPNKVRGWVFQKFAREKV
jgi:glycosyltransferase involved in cell wall biosynthesis